MSYVNRSLSPDEHIIYRTKKHWIIFLIPVIWTLIATALCARIPSLVLSITGKMGSHLYLPLVSIICGIPILFALYFWLSAWLTYATSEFVITTKRLIMREGFFVRHATETRLSTISHVSIDQGISGQIFDYGTIGLNSFGGSSDAFTQIASPVEFQKQVNGQLDKMGSGR